MLCHRNNKLIIHFQSSYSFNHSIHNQATFITFINTLINLTIFSMLSISLLHENIDVCLAVFMESCLMSVNVSSSGCKCFFAAVISTWRRFLTGLVDILKRMCSLSENNDTDKP